MQVTSSIPIHSEVALQFQGFSHLINILYTSNSYFNTVGEYLFRIWMVEKNFPGTVNEYHYVLSANNIAWIKFEIGITISNPNIKSLQIKELTEWV